ncbi:CRE-LGC-11 protein [Caenorhabditis remanei]|uniref:CRE-LGC-11 protein n=1 Tax=Caenorhabditis remanei TaxID=31234 RepID=E3LCV0_CAERE|nr:CRE-LGC-11 protein [Caenorhabditis remanei]
MYSRISFPLLISILLLFVKCEKTKEKEVIEQKEDRNERELAKHLLSDYYQYTRPVRNYSSVLNVTVQPQIYNLVEVNEQNEQIKILLWFPQSWKDDYLTWDPKDWNGIERIIIPKSQIWIPDGYIFNTVEETEPLENHNARVRYDGRVEVDFNKLVDLTCPMSVLSFPFDVQLCALQFGSWSYQAHAISFNVLDTFVPKKSKNSEWDIVSFNATKMTTKYGDTLGGFNVYEEIFYYLELRRKPLYYIVVILLPSFLIVTVSNIGLFTPHGVHGDREEHVSLGLTTMLTMAVILDMVTGQMPRSAEGIPLLGMYVLIEFVISVIAVLVSVGIIFAHERMLYLDATPPYWVYKLFSDEGKMSLEEIEEDFCSKPADLVQELRFCMEEIKRYLDEQEATEKNRIIWQRFFSWADILFSIFFFVANCLVTFFMFMEFIF